jgi:ribonuclease G
MLTQPSAGGRLQGPRPDGQRPEDRDRRGRRSRRRRNRGRGFPDSKYAPEGERTGPPPAAEEREPRHERSSYEGAEHAPRETREAYAPTHSASSAEPVDELPPIILPGESLAKYRGSEVSASTPPPLPPPIPPAPVAATETTAATEAEDDVIDADETEFDEPAHFPRENAIPDAPRHAAVTAPTLESALTAPVPEVPEPTAAVPPPLPPEPDEDREPAVAHLDEEEDRDIQAMILGDAEGIDEVEEGTEDESAEGEGAQMEGAAEGSAEASLEASAEGSIEGAGDPQSGSAEVRERGGRYPHRGIGRRMRRPRRGGRPDGRPDGRPGGDRPAGDRPVGDHEPRGVRSGDRPERSGDRERSVSRPPQPLISDLLKEGQEIIVQIAKEPLGQKGARITSHIALPGRYVVYMPTLEHMGVSRKIASDEERHRLKRILQGRRPGPVGGFITRTAAEGRSEEDIAQDMQFLYNLWQDIRTRAEKRPAPMLLHHDLDIVQRILRDQLADSFKAIWIDNEEAYENVLRFVERFAPALVPKVKLYTRDAPIFDAFNVTAELEKALRPKVWLKSGGYIVINQTEALVAIDVNTGKFVGKSNRLEDTIVKTNTEAIKEIVRQMRLRDLGGIIVIDFIDMDERKNRQKVMTVLEDAMRVDRAPYKILQFNDFGLVAITRKRVKQSLERTLCSPCPHCEGAGYIKSVQTVVSEILIEARKMASSVEGKDVMLRVHPDVAKVLKSHQNKSLEELEEVLRRPVLVKSDPLLHHEKFDLA